MTSVILVVCAAAWADDPSPWDAPADSPPPVESQVTPPPPVAATKDAPPVKAVPVAGSEPDAASAWRIPAFGGRSRVRLAQELVVGSTGGIDATAIEARYVRDELTVALGVPFAAYATPVKRNAEIGNLQLDGYWQLPDVGRIEHAVGAEMHLSLGSGAYTWVDHSDDLWPGTGIDAAWLGRIALNPRTTVLMRGALGIHGARGYEPMPRLYPRFQVAGGVDVALIDRVGFVGEGLISYWDLSPFEATALVRVDPIDALRVRAGFVLPVFVWAGWAPSEQRTGLTETTLLVDVALRL